MKTKVSKHYRDAYNNPRKYDLSLIKTNSIDPYIIESLTQISNGVTDAFRDIQNGTYKFI